jgi:hypothetical protein
MPSIMRQHILLVRSGGARPASALVSRNLRRCCPSNRHAELLILCARIGFNP